MSIFARREIQKRLNFLSSTIGVRKLRQIVKTLNIEGRESNEKRFLESLATEWEVVIVSAFAELGDTKYEKKISNGKRPDIFFCDKGISLLGDVFAISDDQQHKKNPVDEFSAIIIKLWREMGPTKGGLACRVEAIDLSPQANPQASNIYHPQYLSPMLRPVNRGSLKRLALPPLGGLSEYLRLKVCPFFEMIRLYPEEPKSLVIDEYYEDKFTVRFSINYKPEGSGFSCSHPSYTTINDIESHVLWRRLDEKLKQFAFAKEDSPRILFICDAGCTALTDSITSDPEYHLDEVIDYFWQRPQVFENQTWSWLTEKDISAIIVLSIVYKNSPILMTGLRQFNVNVHFHPNPHCNFPLHEEDIRLLHQVISKLPVPIESPQNVLRAVSENHFSSRHLGVFRMNQERIEMSGVELLQILSGELSIEEFCRNCNLKSNPFKDALVRFQTIKSVKVEPVRDRDDDKIIIEFGPQDAAIGPYSVLKKDERQ